MSLQIVFVVVQLVECSKFWGLRAIANERSPSVVLDLIAGTPNNIGLIDRWL